MCIRDSPLGAPLGPFGPSWVPSGAPRGPFEGLQVAHGVPLGPSKPVLDASWAHLGDSVCFVKPQWRQHDLFWSHQGPILPHLEASISPFLSPRRPQGVHLHPQMSFTLYIMADFLHAFSL